MEDPMKGHCTRRDAIRLGAMFAAAGALGACTSTPRTDSELGSVGDPLPGDLPPIDDASSEHSAARDALQRWHNRDRISADRPPRPRQPGGIVPRSAWAKEGPVLSLADPLTRVTRITIHHEGSSPYFSTSMRDALARLESVRRAHRERGWADIGYHYAIDPAGRIYACRPTSLQGAHVKFNNEQNLGVVVLGNFEQQRPTPEALRSLARFLADQMRVYRVPVDRVYTHRELRPTLCPGRNLQQQVIAMRSGSLQRALA